MKVIEKIQIKPHSCIHAGKVQCVVKLSSGGVVWCSVWCGWCCYCKGLYYAVTAPAPAPASHRTVAGPARGGGGGGGGANIHDIPSSCCWALAGPG